MSYQEPTAEVLEVSRAGDIVTTTVEVSRVSAEPHAPAGLYFVDEPEQEIIELHKLMTQGENILTYQTYDYAGDLPDTGAVYLYRVWWTPDQLEAVVDTSRKWIYEEYPDNGNHSHCLLTWKPIAAYADHKTGYQSAGEWITREAYKTYIVDDKLRVRHRAQFGQQVNGER